MKTLLLSAICVLASLALLGQSEGYIWKFPAATTFPTTSAPAIENSQSKQLIKIGGGAVNTGISESIGLGASCTNNMEVASYEEGSGFEFINDDGSGSPIVTNSWTIEMVVKFNSLSGLGGTNRLIGFFNLDGGLDANSDNGIYVTSDGLLYSYSTASGSVLDLATSITNNEWYHLVFTRKSTEAFIRVYINGDLIGNVEDPENVLQPQATNDYNISFFKDDTGYGGEESSGLVKSISVFNKPLASIDVKSRFNNICNDGYLTVMTPNLGYQWRFHNAPYTSVVVGGTSALGYELTPLGDLTDFSTTVDPSLVSLSGSCATDNTIVQYNQGFGLQFSNTPEFVQDEYTIEMVVKFSALSGAEASSRLVGFYNLDGGVDLFSDNGLYLAVDGLLYSYSTATGNVYSLATSITTDEWYNLTFTRKATENFVNVYINGTFAGVIDDPEELLITQMSNNYGITFLKDDTGYGGEESSGSLYKISIFNVALNGSQVQIRQDGVCGEVAIPLPVRLTKFDAAKSGTSVSLTWTTSSEQNNAGYEILRSANGTDFTTIGFVEGKGSTSATSNYTFVDNAPLAGINHYRLKQKDLSGEISYSHIRTVDFSTSAQEIKLFPNPARSVITVTQLKAGDRLSIFNNQGALISRKNVANAQETISVESLPQGVYVLQITDSKNQSKVIRFTKL